MARKRKKGTRKPNKSIYIYCEGSKTEPYYFRSFIQHLSFPGELATVTVVDSEHTDLVGLVAEAKKHKKANRYKLEDDEYWIVVDLDGYPEHAKGFDSARTNNFKIAFSSVCFEFWLLCHYCYSTKAYPKCADLISKALKKHLGDYEKKAPDIFSATQPNLACAKNNANRIRKHWAAVSPEKQPYELNPYTDVDELIKSLEEYRDELEA